MEDFHLIYGMGYIFYATMGFLTNDPSRKFYNKLLQTRTYTGHLMINAIIAITGYYRCKNFNRGETFYFAPFFFLLLLPLVNKAERLATDRNIIILTKGDKKPWNFKTSIDLPASLILILVPLIICGYLSTRFRAGHFPF